MNTFRTQYRQLSEQEQKHIADIKAKADEMLAAMGTQVSREMSLARTKLEESVMWAVKAITG